MRIVVATDSFKGTLTAKQACDAIATGLKRALPNAEILTCPMADGGEGTVDAIVAANSGTYTTAPVTNPLGKPIQAQYGLIENSSIAIIEMASASGLLLVPPNQRDIMAATTFGTGRLIAHALDLGVKRILIGIGGSATNDGGCGMVQALGVRFLKSDGSVVTDHIGGQHLDQIASIVTKQIHHAINTTRIDVCCDVNNPLTGPNGAAYTYAPQKGASPDQVETLDANLSHLATIIQRDLGISLAHTPGAGAAGGLGAGLLAFTNAKLVPGTETVIELVKLEPICQNADAIITGEGKLDTQSLRGKVVHGISALGKRLNVPVYVIAGQNELDPEHWNDHLADVATIADSQPAQDQPHRLRLTNLAQHIATTWFKPTPRPHNL